MAEYTFNSLVQEIAKQKSDLAKSRFRKTEKNEVPREVYLACCKKIAEHYETIGFKYAKSSQCMKLKKGEFTFSISFQSSSYNVADENVKLIVHASVSSLKLKKWRKESPYLLFSENPNGSLGGGQIGNLQKDPTWLAWNVANPETRDELINEIIDRINHFALPFFDEFSDLESIKDIFVTKGQHHSINTVSFLMYFFSKKELEKTFEAFLTKRGFWKNYEIALQEVLKTKNRNGGGSYWEQIAKAKVELDLTLEEN